jgi:hypothetical protein
MPDERKKRTHPGRKNLQGTHWLKNSEELTFLFVYK